MSNNARIYILPKSAENLGDMIEAKYENGKVKLKEDNKWIEATKDIARKNSYLWNQIEVINFFESHYEEFAKGFKIDDICKGDPESIINNYFRKAKSYGKFFIENSKPASLRLTVKDMNGDGRVDSLSFEEQRNHLGMDDMWSGPALFPDKKNSSSVLIMQIIEYGAQACVGK